MWRPSAHGRLAIPDSDANATFDGRRFLDGVSSQPAAIQVRGVSVSGYRIRSRSNGPTSRGHNDRAKDAILSRVLLCDAGTSRSRRLAVP